MGARFISLYVCERAREIRRGGGGHKVFDESKHKADDYRCMLLRALID